ncbi:MAG: AsmA family protein [Halioglobus sp.]
MKKFLLLFLLALVLLAIALAVTVNHLMRDTSRLEAYLTESLGRQVLIANIRDLRIGRESNLVVEGLSIANPGWAKTPQLVQLEMGRVYLDSFSLWGDGPVVIRDLEIQGLRVALEKSGQQGSSWDFQGDIEAQSDRSRDNVQLPLVLEQAHVSDSTVSYLDPKGELTAYLSGQMQGGGGIDLEIEGLWNSQPVNFRGRSEREGKSVALSGDGSYQNWQLELVGAVGDPLSFSGLDFRLGVQGDLPIQLDEESSVQTLPLMLQVHVTGSGRQISLTQGLLQAGDSQLTINGSIGNPATLEGMALDLVLDSPDLKKLLPIAKINDQAVPLELQGMLVSDGKSLQLEKLNGRSGGSHVAVSAQLPLDGDLDGANISVRARGGSAVELLSPWVTRSITDVPFEVDFDGVWEPPHIRLDDIEVRLANNKLNADLQVLLGSQGPALAGHINVSGKRAYSLLEAFDFTAKLPDESYIFESDIEVVADGAFSVDNMDAQLGRSDLSGALSYRPGSPGQLNARLHSGKLDFRFLGNAFDQELRLDSEEEAPPTQLDSNAPLTRAQLDARLIPDSPLRLDWLSNLEGRLEFKVDEVIVRDDLRSYGEFVLSISDNALVSEKLEWGGDFSTGKATLELANLSPGARVDLQLQSHRLPLFWILTGNPKAQQKSDYRASLVGAGTTARELAASLDGRIVLRGGGGQMSNRGLGFLFGDVLGEVFTRIDPSSQQKDYTEMICHAGGVEIDQGMVSVNPGLVLRTEELDMALGGGFSLRDESLNMVFNTRARKGLGISASKALTPYLKLGGNFSHPRLGVNAKGVVVSGSAAVLTGGLSIVAEGMWDRWVATSVNPCEAVFEDSEQAGKELKKLFGRP